MPELAKGSPWNTSHTRRQFAIGAVSLPVALSAPMALAAQGGRHTPLRGINLAGAEFGDPPGVHGRHYQYPGTKHINYYRSLGFNTIRLSFMWERIQPALNQPFAPREERLLTGIVEYATKTGMHVVIDPHNFGKRRLHTDDWKVKHTVGSPQVPATSFADLWTRLAMLFGGNDKVVFGLMNEPHDVPSSDWLPVADAARIRDTGTRATNAPQRRFHGEIARLAAGARWQ